MDLNAVETRDLEQSLQGVTATLNVDDEQNSDEFVELSIFPTNNQGGAAVSCAIESKVSGVKTRGHWNDNWVRISDLSMGLGTEVTSFARCMRGCSYLLVAMESVSMDIEMEGFENFHVGGTAILMELVEGTNRYIPMETPLFNTGRLTSAEEAQEACLEPEQAAAVEAAPLSGPRAVDEALIAAEEARQAERAALAAAPLSGPRAVDEALIAAEEARQAERAALAAAPLSGPRDIDQALIDAEEARQAERASHRLGAEYGEMVEPAPVIEYDEYYADEL